HGEEQTTEITSEGVGHYNGKSEQSGPPGPNQLGAAWQIFGSNSMRQPGGEGRVVKTKPRKPKPYQKDIRPQLPPGKIMMAPPRRRTFHQATQYPKNASIAIDRSAGLSHHPIGSHAAGGNVYGSMSHYDTVYGIRGVERRDNDGFRPFERCTRDEFRCKDGSCISASFQCDGETDCIDESDEANCDRPMQSCPEGEFKCKGALGGMGGPGGRCVLMRFRCDGDNDCGDWSDEENCAKKQVDCMINEFKCDDGDCIPLQWRCDDKQDCNNGEDEKNCPVDRIAGRTCSPDEYTCKDGRCILRSWVCDGSADCRRGEDEQDCDIKCELNQFLCPSGSRNSTRDSHKSFRRPSENWHLTRTVDVSPFCSSVCINQKHVCDGHTDCANGEDEMRCPIVHPCGAHSRCEQLCITAYSGREECMCRPGYLLHGNGYNCTDIDECSITSNPVCSQECLNVAGSFRCSCQPGYVLRPDQRTCKAVGGSVKLLMANRADIRQVSLSNNQYTSIAKGLPNAIALDYHYRQDLLFWTDVSIDVIKRSHLNGSGVRDVIKWGLESPGGLAVDWIHDLLFWTDSGTRRVEVSTLDGQMRAVIAASDLDKPRAIAVHPGRALVFWTDWGTAPKIERAFMDGSDRQTIIAEAIFWPNGLTIDYTSSRIYWADAKHVIESANFDGRARRKILSNNLPHPFALALFEDSMYWTDWHTKTISTASKVNGRGFRVVLEVSDLEEGIRSALVWKDLEQPRGIALDYESGYLFWSDWGANPRIERADMDGENRVDLITEGLGWPNGLAVDRAAKRIYWADAQMKTIESCTLSGGARTKVVENLPHPYALAVTGRTIYWTDWITKALHSVPKGNPAHIRNVTHGLEGLMDVKVVQEDEERHLENVCGAGNGGCSHLCLRNPTGYSCKCPTGLTMREGSTTDCKTLPDERVFEEKYLGVQHHGTSNGSYLASTPTSQITPVSAVLPV
uniref:EGF-like domain-containing protein n=1 Tax=Anopheles coluzzii TaxID=1518534 RepID=A0A8W7Q034_ANOCL